ncbi:hypothetical protein K1T71_010004 [Dendrolimus kikuchii]|uniref:Uncharacterized protein n=1 Tax=Dendrolimus kikuchii TaxID=765133 RepID=A0ACC1CTH7_9NEOP|nr:hypothetical protein K1T71_010004 [Dendrolimus kikuchii]
MVLLHFVYLLILIFPAHGSLLSRFRNPNTYVAPEESIIVPEDLDDELYAELVREVPEYKELLRTQSSPQLPYLKQTPATYMEEFDPDSDDEVTPEATEENTEVFISMADTENATLASVTNAHNMSNNSDSRRYDLDLVWRWKGEKVATCFICNRWPSRIPKETSCHDAFESHNWKMRTLARYFRAECFRNIHWWGERIKVYKNPHLVNWYHKYDRGLKRQYYGKVYTQRNCRGFWPLNAGSHTNHRMLRLEYTMRNKKEGCVMSPHASLTPFARGISLFARYHFCICQGNYCNAATSDQFSFNILVYTLCFRLYIFKN